ncbi:MAG: glycoside hydrolase family 1 protein [Candidatus Nealsonbacteria bacterium CG08_land_8_20_14_0_20_43_11]|uniref:Glycoside hydrolase family 1 protein n=1 Tax=Candidatus Nealsonbacteria bacterium CG08_land_8_20_14_0_20_43_11 TaxID=1974706 RepID=A0A2M6T0W4_9BACT|nr:MAG: glycoside hydrolase family 1 protein [Candidatus Nealsonbacteria bacterium CG08_land_8_20_14_0_20_43_11]
MEKTIVFPENFLWGTATSAYQVEGGIENCDWAKVYPAGLACDHYHLFEKDFDLMKSLNQNSCRFSLEWSRIEPRPGYFDEKEIAHYRQVLTALKSRGFKTIVTLFHFTLPLWLADIGGFASRRTVFYFSRFSEKVFREYQPLVDFWITINEPLIYAFAMFPLVNKKPALFTPLEVRSAVDGTADARGVSPLTGFTSLKVAINQLAGHKKVYKLFHRLDPKAKVGIAKNNSYFEPLNRDSFLDRLGTAVCRYVWNDWFMNRIKKHLDFIGLNYYFHQRIKFPYSLKNENRAVSDLGWEIYPEGIYQVLKKLKRYNLPVYITENGLADAGDRQRPDFIKSHLLWIFAALKEGVDIRGYFHWSLNDNFEWEKGFAPRFGLVEVDYKTLERKPRPSAYYYAEICKNNSL